MRRVDLDLLQNELGAYVRAAEAGERVLVTDGDRVVAELVPHREQRRHGSAAASAERGVSASRTPQFDTDEEFVAYGVREGWLTPATRRGPLPRPVGLPSIPLEQLLADLDKDREDR